jgi:hypothetical protein
MMFHLLRSVLLTSIFSFLIPVVAFSGIMAVLFLAGYIPSFSVLHQSGINPILSILRVFGSGDAIIGLVLIGSVFSLVGVLFDTYAFCRHQKLGD